MATVRSPGRGFQTETCDWQLTTTKSFRYTWKIRNIKNWPWAADACLKSPVFPANEQTQWRLQITTSGESDERKDFVFLKLHSVSNCDDGNNAKVRFAFVDACGQMTERGSCTHLFMTKEGWVYSTCVRRNVLMTKEFEVSTKGILTVLCDVTIQSHTSQESKESGLVLSPEEQLAQDFSQLLGNKTFSDVIIRVGEIQYPAHKAVLSVRSPVFHAMFKSHTKENEVNIVNIPDVDADIFEALLQFVYTGRVQNLEDVAQDLFIAADKYQFNQLKDLCQVAMFKSLSVDNASTFLVLADLHSAGRLKNQCIEFINRHSSKIVQTDSWKEMVRSRPYLAVEIYVKLVSEMSC